MSASVVVALPDDWPRHVSPPRNKLENDMTITASFHNPKSAEHKPLPGVANDCLSFDGENSEHISIYVPPHVAAHTAAAFNRAMQAVPDRDAIGEGWTYTTKSGVWHIRDLNAAGYQAQHDEVTGDNDPGFLFAYDDTLIGCMAIIDDIEAEEACDVCHLLVGADALTDHEDSLYCAGCAKTEAERERGMAEMALDDMAHAAREKAMGL